jgi:hypothetical protein
MNDGGVNPCDRLDAYFDGDLAVDERRAFVAHLSACPACSEAVDQQHWIDGLLQSEAAAAIELAPAIEIPLRRIHRRRLVLAAAAAAFVALAARPLLPLPRREGPGEGAATAARQLSSDEGGAVGRPSPSPSAPRPLFDLQGRGIGARATFASNGSAIAVPLPAVAPDVTVMRLYPTATPAPRRTHFAYVQLTDANGG